MSLIDDALKRAQAADEAAARAGDRPWIPTPMPDPAIARRRAVARGLGIAGVAAAVVAAGAWLAMRIAPGGAPGAAGSEREPSASAAAAIPATPTPDAVAVATPIVVGPPAAVAPPRPTRAPRPAPAADVAAAGSPEAPSPVPPPAHPSRESSTGRTYAGVATLPGGGRIELGGIVWSETEPRALLNDRIVGTGAYVEGCSVQRIDEDRVVLEKDGATITITLK